MSCFCSGSKKGEFKGEKHFELVKELTESATLGSGKALTNADLQLLYPSTQSNSEL